MKIRRLFPDILECSIIAVSAAANIFMSVTDVLWATLTMTNCLIGGTTLMSLNQTHKKIRTLDKKLTDNGKPKLKLSTKIIYWILPSFGSLTTIGFISYYNYYNIANPNPKLLINLLYVGGATIVLPYAKKLVNGILRKEIESIEVQPDPRIGELERALSVRTDERDALRNLSEQRQQENEGLQERLQGEEENHERTVNKIKQDHRKVIQEIEYKHSENMEKKEKDYSRHLADLETQHTKTIEEKQIEFDKIRESLEHCHRKEISAIESKHDEEIKKAKKTHLKEISDFEKRYKERIFGLTQMIDIKQQAFDKATVDNQQIVEQVNHLIEENKQVLAEKERLQQTTVVQDRQPSALRDTINNRYGIFSHAAHNGQPAEEMSLQEGCARKRSVSFGGWK